MITGIKLCSLGSSALLREKHTTRRTLDSHEFDHNCPQTKAFFCAALHVDLACYIRASDVDGCRDVCGHSEFGMVRASVHELLSVGLLGRHVSRNERSKRPRGQSQRGGREVGVSDVGCEMI
jgi:hypothetical protein